jgi:hypothetical protein
MYLRYGNTKNEKKQMQITIPEIKTSESWLLADY